MIKELLAAPANATYTGWNALKREPKRPTNKEVRFYLQHIQRLQHLAQQLPAVDIPVPKLKQFRAMARALDASELAELKPEVVLLGTGSTIRFVPPRMTAALTEIGVAVECMDTAAACRTYNILMSEGRRVVTALLF